MDSGHHAYTRFEPAGVVAAIAPWNFPLMLETWKVAPALAWGNTVVLKPAEDTPGVGDASWPAWRSRPGMPAGRAQRRARLRPRLGRARRSPSIPASTGSPSPASPAPAGSSRAPAAANLIPVSLELGGKGANIVFDDADLDNAVAWSIQAIFRNAGQVCLAGCRLYVQRGIYDEFLDRFIGAAEALVIGDPKRRGHPVRPAGLAGALQEGPAYLDDVEADGGTILTGGLGEGWVVKPTVVVERCRPTAPGCREEIFGPVVVVSAVRHRGRGGRAGQRHAVRAERHGVHREPAAARTASRPR